eukprot:g10750.t1
MPRLFLILAANYVALAKRKILRQKQIVNNGPTTVHELVAQHCTATNGDAHIDVAIIDPIDGTYEDGEEDNCKHCVEVQPGTVTIGRIEPGVEIQLPDKSSVCVWRSSKDNNIKATRTCEAGDKEDPVDVKGSVHLDDGRLLDGQNKDKPLFASKCGAGASSSTNPKSVNPQDANDDGQRHSSTSTRAPKPTEDAPAEGHGGSEAPTPSASASTKHTAPTPSSDEAEAPTPSASASTKHTATPSSDKARESTKAPAEGNRRSKGRRHSASTEHKHKASNSTANTTKQEKKGHTNGKTKKKEEAAPAPGPCYS